MYLEHPLSSFSVFVKRKVAFPLLSSMYLMDYGMIGNEPYMIIIYAETSSWWLNRNWNKVSLTLSSQDDAVHDDIMLTFMIYLWGQENAYPDEIRLD